MDGISGTSKTGSRYYSCLNQRKKKCSAKTVRKNEIELRIEEIVESFLHEPEMLASLAVNLADHYKKTHGRGDEILKALEARRTDGEIKLANFVKAISQVIFNASTAEAMNALEAQKQELDAAIQAEHVKATLYEDEASIGAFYKRFAEATMDTPEIRDQLFEYFVDKIFIGREQIIIAPYYHDSAGPIEFEELEEALTSGHRAGEVRTYARKREFDASPWSGAKGEVTRNVTTCKNKKYERLRGVYAGFFTCENREITPHALAARERQNSTSRLDLNPPPSPPLTLLPLFPQQINPLPGKNIKSRDKGHTQKK
nr:MULTISPECIES: zinc ribbon domain-containing protein [unclassified Corynebacterium]